MTVLGKTMGRKSQIVYLATIIGGALLFGALINALIPADWILGKIPHLHGDGHEHQMMPVWLQWVSNCFNGCRFVLPAV